MRKSLSVTLMYGLQRVFIGDTDADALRIPDSRIKHVLRYAGPVLAAVGWVQQLRVSDREAAVLEAYRVRDSEMARMRGSYRVEHDLVDAAPH
jgi:hypothetical protein